MKTIGIKLADGSFYPILEEGTAKTYQLDLTTVKDGQTKVQIDLYRSATGTMDDAEYVDTLEVTNLVPHPNGEVELHLSVGLNEDNELDAKVVDEETGKESETNVTLVSRTLAERSEPTNFELTEEPGSAAPESLPEEASEENSDNSGAVAAAAVAGAAAGAAAVYAATKDDESTHSDDSLADFTFDNFADDESAADTPAGDDGLTQADELTEDVEDVPFSFDSEIEAEQRETEFTEESLPEFEESDFAAEPVAEETVTDNFAAETLEEPVFEEPVAAETVTDDFAAETVAETSSDENFDLPEFDDNSFAAEETTAEPVNEDFALPDFDEPAVTDSTQEATEASGLTGYFDDPAFSEDPAFTDADLNTGDNEIDFSTNELDSSPASPAMDFSDLYDKETLNGETSSYDEEDEVEKKTRVPVIICIICAIICVIATLLILFIIPSKYNLLKHNTKETVVIEKTEELPPPVEEPAPVEEAEPEAPAAVEDQIVVAPEPEIVVPVPAPAPEPEKAKDIKYRIRWGDTLWDIADAYYKNPWRYPKIAKYNKIKNPDLIISGTDILIPVE